MSTSPEPRPLALRAARMLLLAIGYVVGGLVAFLGAVWFSQPGTLDDLMARGTFACIGVIIVGVVEAIRRATSGKSDPSNPTAV